MHQTSRDRVHVVINTHNRLSLIRHSIPRILAATASGSLLSVTHTIYDDNSESATRDYLLSLLDGQQIDNLILGSGDLTEYQIAAQTNNPFIANYLQVLRACLFVAPATWVLHFTDDALIRFTGRGSGWLHSWIQAMKIEPRIVSMQMTDHNVNLLETFDAESFGLPPVAILHRTNFISDRYTLYRYGDLLAAFQDHVTLGQYPLAFEEWLNSRYSVAQPNGSWAVVCQWDNEYVGTHIGATGAGILFTEEYVAYLLNRLDQFGPTMSLSERTEFT